MPKGNEMDTELRLHGGGHAAIMNLTQDPRRVAFGWTFMQA
jgi:hypothetical protein